MRRNRSRFRVNPRGMQRLKVQYVAYLVEAGAVIAVNEIKRQMTDAPPRTGARYRVPGTQTLYTASAEGEPPAVREGRYLNSWQNTPAIFSRGSVDAFAFSDLATEDGRYLIGDLLENGTIHMAPRPHIRPALPIIQQKIDELAREIFE